MAKDRLFTTKKKFKFSFSKQVVEVFTDMITRSVPGYKIAQSIINYLIPFFKIKILLDLGSSNGLLIKYLAKFHKLKFIGIDNSPFMIKSSPKIKNTQFILGDLTSINFPSNDCTILNYTLQFIDPAKRLHILKKINKALTKNSPLIISEKVKANHKKLQNIIDANYLNFKIRNHYSKQEVYRKKASLDNVLIPLTTTKLEELLTKSNFIYEPIYRYYNFVTYLCIKK